MLKAFIPVALAASICGSARAATYTAGDLLLGFVAGGGQGSDSTLVVNLGSASSYRNAFDSHSNSLAIVNIGNQLSAQFGANWYERADLYVSLFGTPSAGATSSTLYNGDPSRTLYVSQARNAVDTLGSASSAGWGLSGSTAFTDSAGGILNTSTRFAATTSDPVNVAIIPDSDANTLDEFTRPTTNVSFGNFNDGIEATFGTGAFGTYGPAGSVEAALDLYRLQARNNIAGQYGLGESTTDGVYKGTFTIGQNGAVSYISTVPEPGSASVLVLAATGLLFRRRRSA